MKALDATFQLLLEHLHRGGSGMWSYWWLNDRVTGRKNTCWWPVGSPTPLAHQPGVDMYFGLNPVREIPQTDSNGDPAPPEHVCGRNELISVVNALFCDFDLKDFSSQQALFSHVLNLPVEPSCIIASGSGGLHLYWLLSKPFTIDSSDHRDAIQYIVRTWAAFCGADLSASHLKQAPRVPGSYNHKHNPARPVALWLCDVNKVYDLGDLTIHLPAPQVSRSQPRSPANPFDGPITRFNTAVPIADLLERFGYRRSGRRRMISPYSGSGRDGVAIDEVRNKCYVHTGGDPLATGFWASPFDVLMTLDFGGDRDRALAAIRNLPL